MSGKITLSGEGLRSLQQEMLTTAALMAEVADGAYVTGTMFSETKGSGYAAALDEALGVLAACATSMLKTCLATGAYFGHVVESMDEWDYATALASYQAGQQQLGFQVPNWDGVTDLGAFMYGYSQDVNARYPNQPPR